MEGCGVRTKRVDSESCSWGLPGTAPPGTGRAADGRCRGHGTNCKRIQRILSGPPGRHKPCRLPADGHASREMRQKKGAWERRLPGPGSAEDNRARTGLDYRVGPGGNRSEENTSELQA